MVHLLSVSASTFQDCLVEVRLEYLLVSEVVSVFDDTRCSMNGPNLGFVHCWLCEFYHLYSDIFAKFSTVLLEPLSRLNVNTELYCMNRSIEEKTKQEKNSAYMRDYYKKNKLMWLKTTRYMWENRHRHSQSLS